MSDRHPCSPFQLTGQLVDIVWKDGHKPKYFKLTLENQEVWVKIPKALRSELNPQLTVNSWVQITGTIKRAKKTGIPKFKAETVELVSSAGCATLQTKSDKKAAKVPTVLVCQKSSCRKRGADRVCKQLQADLAQIGLGNQVKIKKTGCLKKCKQGPNVVFLPDKAKYTRVRANDVTPLVQKHCGAIAN